MDDSEFDKRYADKIRRAGAPDLSDEDWERLTPRLDAVQRRRWRVMPLWWLGALSGLFLCSNISWWYMWQQSEKRNKAMQSEWQQIRRESMVMRDTTWSKVVVYQYDTVYRTVVYRAVTGSIASDKSMALGQGNTSRMGTENTTVSRDASNAGIATAQSILNLGQVTTPLDTSAIAPRIITQSKQNLGVLPIQPTFLKIPARQIKTPEKDLALAPIKRSHAPREPILIPRKFRLGAGAGFVMPSSAQLSGNSGFVTALTGEIAFSEALALVLEGAYSGISFTGTQYDDALGLPPFPTPGDDYVLKHFESEEGLKPILQLGAGLRYWLRSEHKLSPYLGLGYAAQWHPEFELKLEYVHKVTNEEEERSFEVPPLGSTVSLLDLNAGVRYRFMRHLSLQTGAFYQFKIDTEQPGIPRFWGLKSSVMYEF